MSTAANEGPALPLAFTGLLFLIGIFGFAPYRALFVYAREALRAREGQPEAADGAGDHSSTAPRALWTLLGGGGSGGRHRHHERALRPAPSQPPPDRYVATLALRAVFREADAPVAAASPAVPAGRHQPALRECARNAQPRGETIDGGPRPSGPQC
ncbi:MAG: hypothetical protein D6731_08690 [Planctomycetota bacterium]|nr:MAG: hypothetical protein D6731_08690 [Planctomycetota bacterium]